MISRAELADYCSDVLSRTVDNNPYIPVTPTSRQAVFLSRWEQEVLFGGAAGGGKTAGLLMSALQYVDVPGYAALLVRRTFPDLIQPGGLISLAREWLSRTAARPQDEGRRWIFPSGARLEFGYLETDSDKYRYQGGEYQFIGFDELTQMQETSYVYLFSRLRKRAGVNVPLRMRAGSNPGGIGHQWVKSRFLTCGKEDRIDRAFIISKLVDNPHLDQGQYLAALNRLDPVTRQQLRDGDWDIARQGGVFDVEGLMVQRGYLQTGRSGMLVA